MNPFFWILVLIVLFLFWVFLRRYFISIGDKTYTLVEDMDKILNYKDEKENEENVN